MHLQGDSLPRDSADLSPFHPLTPRQEEIPAASVSGFSKGQAEDAPKQEVVAELREEDHLAIQASIFKSLDGAPLYVMKGLPEKHIHDHQLTSLRGSISDCQPFESSAWSTSQNKPLSC